MLKEHVAAAVEVVKQAKAGNDEPALDAAIAAAHANAQQIADFLSGAKPYWKQDEERNMLKNHIDSTLVCATAVIQGRFADGSADHEAEARCIWPMR